MAQYCSSDDKSIVTSADYDSKGLKTKHFLLEDDYCNLNHGSFGTVPANVFNQHVAFLREQERRPDEWFRATYYRLIDESRSAIAALIHASADDVVLVENASAAVNAILRSAAYKRGDKVVLFSNAYSMVTETLSWLNIVYGVEVVTVPMHWPIAGPEQLIAAFDRSLSSIHQADPAANVKFCLFSHIGSMPTCIEPVKELTALAHKHGSQVIIDGAHAPGVIDIDVGDIDADYYLGNCHKWLFCPKGTAFLWVSASRQAYDALQPSVISSSCVRTFTGRFAYTGTRDYTPFACIPAALSFVNDSDTIGSLQKMRRYNHSLCVRASHMLASLWGTQLLVPDEMVGFMANVVLPSRDEAAIDYVQKTLDKRHNTFFVYSKLAQSEGESIIFFVRISAQVYVDLGDFEQFGQLVLSCLDEYAASASLL